jgi:hypothetical protein
MGDNMFGKLKPEWTSPGLIHDPASPAEKAQAKAVTAKVAAENLSGSHGGHHVSGTVAEKHAADVSASKHHTSGTVAEKHAVDVSASVVRHSAYASGSPGVHHSTSSWESEGGAFPTHDKDKFK